MIEITKQKQKLYKEFVKNSPYAKWNKSRIDYVLNKVYKKQITTNNKCEQKVLSYLWSKGFDPEVQKIIPVLKSGGKIDHLYIADIVLGNTIIEVDGPQHQRHKFWDERRDAQTEQEGYRTIRIPTSDLSEETIESYLGSLS